MTTRRDPFAPRAYRHFDVPLSRALAEKLATNPDRVAHHSFLPFIRRTVVTPRYRKDEHKVVPKKRPIAYAAHADAVIYSYYSQVLSEAYESRLSALALDRVPVAYRRFSDKQCNIHFAQTAFDFISENRPCVALGFDVKEFFDHIDHGLLLKSWREVLQVDQLSPDHYNVYKSLTKWAWVDEGVAYSKLKIRLGSKGKRGASLCTLDKFKSKIRGRGFVEKNQLAMGIPQGSPMSAVLSNIYLIPFDLKILHFATQCGGFVQRYCDDILMVVPPEYSEMAKEVVSVAAVERKLFVHIEGKKLDIVSFPSVDVSVRVEKPIQYLGMTFDGQARLIRSQTISRFHRKIRFYLKKAAFRASKNPHNKKIFTKTLWKRFGHTGEKTFRAYVDRCVKTTGSIEIKKQLSGASRRICSWTAELQP